MGLFANFLPWLLMMFIWIGLIVYLLSLAARFVRAVEKIAEKL